MSAKKAAKKEATPKAEKAPKASKKAKTAAPATSEADLLGTEPAKPAKVKKEKPAKEPKVKKERTPKADRPVRTPVDQEPKEVAYELKRLKAASADLLAAIHASDKPSAIADLATTLGTDAKGIANRAKSLIDAGLVVKDDKAKTLDAVGNRQSMLGQLLETLRGAEKPLTSAAIGKRLWADPKAPGNRDTVRFGRAAGRLLTAATALGVVRQFTQPRRKFSAEKIRKLYTATAE
jgi:hypothetical protein